jgi:UDP-glucose 4-epimerase
VVGANGFLGGAVVAKCLDKGWEVDCLVNENKENISKEVSNIYTIESIGTASYDFVFNMAAAIPYGDFNKTNEKLIDTNISLPVYLHRQFIGAKIIYASSVSVYGNTTGVINEDSGMVSPNKYGLSKLCGELITSHHDRYSIVRFSSLYGRGMNGSTFIPRIVQDARDRKIITLLGSGERKQNYVYVSDAAGYCIQAALDGTNEIYLGVDVKSYSNKEVAEIVAGNIPGCKISYIGEDTSPSFEYENEHTLTALNFRPEINLEFGIKELING